jgi:hypothetical protein
MTSFESSGETLRCAIVVDAALPKGKAANAGAVIALTLGKRHPYLAGADLVDASGCAHPGLIPVGIALLGAPVETLPGLRARALERGFDVVGFAVQGQATKDYDTFLAAVREVATEALDYVGIGVVGPAKGVRKLVGELAML